MARQVRPSSVEGKTVRPCPRSGRSHGCGRQRRRLCGPAWPAGRHAGDARGKGGGRRSGPAGADSRPSARGPGGCRIGARADPPRSTCVQMESSERRKVDLIQQGRASCVLLDAGCSKPAWVPTVARSLTCVDSARSNTEPVPSPAPISCAMKTGERRCRRSSSPDRFSCASLWRPVPLQRRPAVGRVSAEPYATGAIPVGQMSSPARMRA